MDSGKFSQMMEPVFPQCHCIFKSLFKKNMKKKHGKVIYMILAVHFLLKITGKIESLQKTVLRDTKVGVC